MRGLGVVVAAFLSTPTVAVWCLAFLNAKPAWRKDDDAAEAGMEIDMSAMLGVDLAGVVLSDFAFATRGGSTSFHVRSPSSDAFDACALI